jgi:putative FmdB family regulatory protein
MPVYEYQCSACSHAFEEWQKIKDPPIKTCPKCGKDAVERLISQTAFMLKGGGWYKDLYSSSKGNGAAESGGSSASSDGKSDKTETKSDGKKTESKPSTDSGSSSAASSSSSSTPSSSAASSSSSGSSGGTSSSK